jgi:hypothetical protein
MAPKFIVEFTSGGCVQIDVEAEDQDDAVKEALNIDYYLPIRPVHKDPSYPGWQELCIRVSPVQDEEDHELAWQHDEEDVDKN